MDNTRALVSSVQSCCPASVIATSKCVSFAFGQMMMMMMMKMMMMISVFTVLCGNVE